MGETYSHSRLEAFEWCAESYKVKYVLKAFPEVPLSAELFLGNMVHQSLEWLYTVVKERVVTLDQLIAHFLATWNAEFPKELRVRNGTAKEVQDKGVQFLINYYTTHAPFREETIAIEQEVLFALDEGREYAIKGYIDRLVRAPDGAVEVHDYKTSKYPKTQEQADKDRQLAFYELGVRELFSDVTNVRLIWHFLADNVEVQSTRTAEQLTQLKKDTIALIKRIEANTRWPSCGKEWCDWCVWKRNNFSESRRIIEQDTKIMRPTHSFGNKTVHEFL